MKCLIPFVSRYAAVLLTSVTITVVGCGTETTETVEENELASYLDEHPELAETVEDDTDPAENNE
ncbi:hypothetical protein [Roseiconus lacunae]|uniref:hypothetical protein n=1 Tax=Roseiconus lacunae TaxID=2605694 RepID=UPI0011F0D9C0|nr:hypothetical protein [Roseiconus lacunae]MCD0462576.1 hypothetical protein [Roseiconus lacunae]WRQ50670.1 hypothetical protein U8335_27445 [Stieleria sp. HD01]